MKGDDLGVRVVRWEEVPPIPLPGHSWSRLLLTAATAGAGASMLGLSTFTPGTRTPRKVHQTEELCYILSGEGELDLPGAPVSYRAGMAFRVPPGVPHGVVNTGTTDLVMVFVFPYPDYPPTRDG